MTSVAQRASFRRQSDAAVSSVAARCETVLRMGLPAFSVCRYRGAALAVMVSQVLTRRLMRCACVATNTAIHGGNRAPQRRTVKTEQKYGCPRCRPVPRRLKALNALSNLPCILCIKSYENCYVLSETLV